MGRQSNSAEESSFRLYTLDVSPKKEGDVSTFRFQHSHTQGWSSRKALYSTPRPVGRVQFKDWPDVSETPTNRLRKITALTDDVPLPPVKSPDLDEALSDLDSIHKFAREDDLPEPSKDALENARALLPKMYNILPGRYHVSPTERRGVAIDAPARSGGAVVLECAPLNRVYCFVTVDGNRRRAKYYQTDRLPDEFITRALRDLAS